jgi:hypothetical protein
VGTGANVFTRTVVRKLSLKRKGQAREEDHVTVVALQGVQISLQEISLCACPKAAGSEGPAT